MNILFVSQQIYPCYFGGTEVFNYYLARELVRDSNVTLFTCCDRAPEGVDLVSINKVRPARYLTPLRLAWHIVRHRRDIDVVFLSYSRSHWFGWTLYPLLQKLLGIRYVITIHGGGLTPWKPFALYDWCFRNAFRLIGISERICDEYRKRTGLEVRYVPPLFPFSRTDKESGEVRRRFEIPEGSKVILYVGSLKELKSPDTLVDAFNMLDERFIEGEDLYLVLAGDGPMREGLKKKAKYRDRMKFLGNVPREEMPDLYSIADLYVMPSQFEGTPLSLLEAVFNRVPVIGSDVGGINAIIENGRNGILFGYRDHEALASGMKKLLMDQDLRRKCIEEALKTYETKYTYDRVIEVYKETFREAADES
jgi:glycosyltransferase involved in cell wall biosynthesis